MIYSFVPAVAMYLLGGVMLVRSGLKYGTNGRLLTAVLWPHALLKAYKEQRNSDDHQWNYLMVLVRADKFLNPLGYLTAGGVFVFALVKAFAGHYLLALLGLLVAASIVCLIRWQPPFIKEFDFVDGDDEK